MTGTIAAITRSGRRFDILSPAAAQVRISDIADHLARLNRWCGASERPFSVAQHSVLVANEMDRHDGPMAALYGMLHDAHETYIGDIAESTTSALECLAPGLRAALERLRATLDDAIHAAFDLDWPIPATTMKCLALAHDRTVAAECRDIVPVPHGERLLKHFTRACVTPLRHRIAPYANHIVAAEQWIIHFDRFALLAGCGHKLR